MNDVWIVGDFCSAGALIGYFISPIKVAVTFIALFVFIFFGVGVLIWLKANNWDGLFVLAGMALPIVGVLVTAGSLVGAGLRVVTRRLRGGEAAYEVEKT